MSKNEDPIISELNIKLMQKKDMSYKEDEEITDVGSNLDIGYFH